MEAVCLAVAAASTGVAACHGALYVRRATRAPGAPGRDSGAPEDHVELRGASGDDGFGPLESCDDDLLSPSAAEDVFEKELDGHRQLTILWGLTMGIGSTGSVRVDDGETERDVRRGTDRGDERDARVVVGGRSAAGIWRRRRSWAFRSFGPRISDRTGRRWR